MSPEHGPGVSPRRAIFGVVWALLGVANFLEPPTREVRKTQRCPGPVGAARKGASLPFGALLVPYHAQRDRCRGTQRVVVVGAEPMDMQHAPSPGIALV